MKTKLLRMKFSKIIYECNLPTALIFGLLISSCGVKGDPTPPVNPVYIGTGKYIKQSNANLITPVGKANINNVKTENLDNNNSEIIKVKKVKKKKKQNE
jgi:hypothetical protein